MALETKLKHQPNNEDTNGIRTMNTFGYKVTPFSVYLFRLDLKRDVLSKLNQPGILCSQIWESNSNNKKTTIKNIQQETRKKLFQSENNTHTATHFPGL